MSRCIDDDECWKEHGYQKYSRGKIYYSRNGRIIQTPEDIKEYIPADVAPSNNSYQLNVRTARYRAPMNEIYTNNEINSFKNFIIEEQKDQPGTIKICECNEQLIQTDNITNITICTDGGLRNNKGGLGVIVGINNIIAIKGVKRVKETYNEMTSYRTEALGVLTGLYLYKRMQKYLQFKNIIQNYYL
jgi:hypothetical protein